MSDLDSSQLPVGTILEGKFRVCREIGRGGMAAVYEAENIDIGKRVAVKILSADLITSRVVRERFLREARAAAAIRSPYICDVYDSGTYDERPFLVMELLEGESLYELQARQRRLDIEVTLRLTLQTAKGLAKAHAAGVVHRDLKPENIFLTHNEDGELVAKIVDFGLAKFYETADSSPKNARLTREGALFGTPAYMAPEQAQGQGNVDHRCDLWALSCIVYECLTARTVWRVDQGVAMILAQIASAAFPVPSQIRSDLPPSFDEWFAKAMQRDPNQRFQTAKEFAIALSGALAPHPSSTNADNSAVDELLRNDSGLGSMMLPSPLPAPPASSGAFPDMPRASVPPPPPYSSTKKTRLRRIATAVLVAGAAAVAGYVAWLQFFGAGRNHDDPLAEIGSRTASSLKPLEKEPWALQIGAGQIWLAKGDPQRAATMFREAFKNGGAGLARNMLSHAEAILENRNSRCSVTGLARPRPFSVTSPSSRPTVIPTSAGVVVAWADTHQDVRERRGYTVLLDSDLRRVTEAQLITPESRGVRHPQLFSAQDRLGVVYWESGDGPGVYARLLQPDGRIAGPPVKLSTEGAGEYYPAVLALRGGGFWALWEGRFEKKQDDLVARRLNENLEPMAAPVRLTAFRSSSGSVSRPHVSLLGSDRVFAAFSLRQKKSGRIVGLVLPLDDTLLGKGVTGGDSDLTEDRHVGNLLGLSEGEGVLDQARVECGKDGCLVAWDNERGGATLALVDLEKSRVIWRRSLGAKGSRPALAQADGHIVLVWFDNSRVHIAHVSRDGLGPSSIVGKVSGFQPYPALAPGKSTGEWYVSWRDYESGHLESFVARVRCNNAGR